MEATQKGTKLAVERAGDFEVREVRADADAQPQGRLATDHPRRVSQGRKGRPPQSTALIRVFYAMITAR